jgi:hypothetical protein
MIVTPMRGATIDMQCLDKLASFLFYAMVVDFSLEILDFVHRIYESEESIGILGQLVSGRLFASLVVIQLLMGMIVPLVLIIGVKLLRFPADLRKTLYFVSALLVQVGIFSTRWNVVIGGQLFSKSLRGLTTYKMSIMGIEGLLTAIVLLVLPLLILAVLLRILPPWNEARNPVDRPAEPAPTP